MSKPPFSQAFFHTLLHYDPDTRIFTWREGRKRVKAGERAGSLDSSGYRQIMVCGVAYLSGRLAWFYVKGVWPEGLIDHRDNDQINDAWLNLREATPSTSAMNRRKRAGSRSQFIGVYAKGGKWEASICRNSQRKYLGVFGDEVAAARSYDRAAKELFGEFAKLNFMGEA